MVAEDDDGIGIAEGSETFGKDDHEHATLCELPQGLKGFGFEGGRDVRAWFFGHDEHGVMNEGAGDTESEELIGRETIIIGGDEGGDPIAEILDGIVGFGESEGFHEVAHRGRSTVAMKVVFDGAGDEGAILGDPSGIGAEGVWIEVDGIRSVE